jgi:hypothetical protein
MFKLKQKLCCIASLLETEEVRLQTIQWGPQHGYNVSCITSAEIAAQSTGRCAIEDFRKSQHIPQYFFRSPCYVSRAPRSFPTTLRITSLEPSSTSSISQRLRSLLYSRMICPNPIRNLNQPNDVITIENNRLNAL